MVSANVQFNEPMMAAAASIIATVLGFIKWLLPWVKKRHVSRKSVQELRTIQKIYAIMNEMVDETTAERVIIFAGHDSGEIPKAGSPYYTSSIYWIAEHDRNRWGDDKDALDKQTHQDIADYKEITVDGHYIDMLLRVQNGKSTLIKTEDLPDGSQLRGFYEMEGIVESIIQGIGYVKNNFLYISIATFNETGFTQTEIERLKLKALGIRREFGLTK